MLDDVAEEVGGADGERGVAECEVSRPAVRLAEHADPAGGVWLSSADGSGHRLRGIGLDVGGMDGVGRHHVLSLEQRVDELGADGEHRLQGFVAVQAQSGGGLLDDVDRPRRRGCLAVGHGLSDCEGCGEVLVESFALVEVVPVERVDRA